MKLNKIYLFWWYIFKSQKEEPVLQKCDYFLLGYFGHIQRLIFNIKISDSN